MDRASTFGNLYECDAGLCPAEVKRYAMKNAVEPVDPFHLHLAGTLGVEYTHYHTCSCGKTYKHRHIKRTKADQDAYYVDHPWAPYCDDCGIVVRLRHENLKCDGQGQ